ncbi:helix-turn-helix domain-containing protein [Streptomyces sp. AK02-01A]|nr:helix-turn-helix domain-containing protein [Streptomyces sp. AK02-01A]
MDLGRVMSALSDPLRRSVVLELLDMPEGEERTCASFRLPVSKSSQTHHFRVLREAGIIWDPNYGNRRGVTVRQDDLDKRFPGLLDLLRNERGE